MKKLKMALVGCGRIGSTKHVEAILKNMDVLEPVAVCDVVEEKAKATSSKILERGGVEPRVYTDFIKMIENEELDFVAVATESGYHYEITVELLKKDLHVLVENLWLCRLNTWTR